jgi:ribosomal small subunit protein bTHX
MGKGDKKSKKGKIAKGSYGNSRKRKAIRAKLKRRSSKKPAAAAEGAVKQKRTIKKKAEA